MSGIAIRPCRANEWEQVGQQVAGWIAGDDLRRADRLHRRWLAAQARPGFRAGEARLGMQAGTLVSSARVVPRTLRYGGARLKVAVIQDVATDPDYRNRGFATAVVRDTLTYAAELGAHLALLRTSGPLFDQFGFTPVWPDYTLQMPTPDAVRQKATVTPRPATLDDIPALADLYDRHWGARVTFTRPLAWWRWRMAEAPEAPIVVVEGDEISGYLWFDPTASKRIEVVTDTPAAAQTFIAHEGFRLNSSGHQYLEWAVPPDDILLTYARAWLPVSLEVDYHPQAGWLGRLIDASAFLKALMPEVNDHMRARYPAFSAAALKLHVQPETLGLSLKQQPETAVSLSHRDFLQLAFGSLRASDLALRQGLNPASIGLLETLFPPRVAGIAAWDR